MNLYESILQVSNCIKEKGEVKELLEKYQGHFIKYYKIVIFPLN